MKLYSYIRSYLQDNNTKRTDAEKKAADAKRVSETKEHEVGKLRDQLEQLKKEEEEKKQLLEKCMLFANK